MKKHFTSLHFTSLLKPLILIMVISFLSCNDGKNEKLSKDINAEKRDYPAFCVPTQDQGCTRTTDVLDSVKITNSFGQNCYMLIEYDYDICPTGIKIFNETITFSKSGNCNEIETYINNQFANGQFANATENLAFLHSLVFKEIEKKILASLDPLDYSCSVSPVNFSSQIITVSCRRLCAQEDFEGGFFNINLNPCGRGCCVKYTSFCFDDKGNLQTLAPQITASNNSCEDLELCSPTSLSGPCNLSCNRVSDLQMPKDLEQFFD